MGFTLLRRIAEGTFGLAETMNVNVGYAYDGQSQDRQVRLIWRQRLNVNQFQGIFKQASRHCCFGFQSPEFPGPLQIEVPVYLIATLRLSLALFKVAEKEGLTGMVEDDLRRLST
jgi:hypothetical protein